MTQQEKNVKHFGKEWSQLLAPFLVSKEYKEIGEKLMKLNKTPGTQVTPSLTNVFRAFSECPMYKLHTIIVGMDPYSKRAKDGDLVADGLAFSARNCEDAPKSLNNIYEALDTSVFDGEYVPRGSWNQQKGFIGHSLKHWADDGILLLNCGLTTVVGQSNTHIPLWRPFIEWTIHKICEHKDSLGVILMGTHARMLKPLVIKNRTHRVFECEHPIAGSYQGRAWRHNNVFRDLTEFHKESNNLTIDW